MKFNCLCGRVIVDSADCSPVKAHVIPDQEAFSILDAIDAAISHSGSSAHAKAVACMKVRALLSDVARRIWQCQECGRLWIEDKAKEIKLKAFRPESGENLVGILAKE